MKRNIVPIKEDGSYFLFSDLIAAAKDGFSKGSALASVAKGDSHVYSYSSAAKAASNLICTFPLLCSKSVSSKTAQMMSKYIESKGCILLQLALQSANISNAKNGIEYVSKFHQNLNIGGNGIDVLSKAIDAWATNDYDKQTGSADVKAESVYDDSEIYSFYNATKVTPLEKKSIMESMTRFLQIEQGTKTYDPYQTEPISSYAISENNNVYSNYYALLEKGNGHGSKNRRWNNDSEDYDNEVINSTTSSANGGSTTTSASNSTGKPSNPSSTARPNKPKKDRSSSTKTDKGSETSTGSKPMKRVKSDLDGTTSINVSDTVTLLQNQDVKKMNNAVPTLLKVKFYSRDNVGSTAVETSFLIGVKGVVIGCNADEILRRIVNDNSDGKFFFNFMRAFTGETRFIRDFLLALDTIDDDIRALKKKGSHGDIWKTLQNRSFAAKNALRNGAVNPAAAVTTVVISQDDAESLYKEENIDITKPSIARRFMTSYNLFGFAIVDDNNESLKVMFDDGNKYFEEISYKLLERESKNDDFVKAITLLAKSTR